MQTQSETVWHIKDWRAEQRVRDASKSIEVADVLAICPDDTAVNLDSIGLRVRLDVNGHYHAATFATEVLGDSTVRYAIVETCNRLHQIERDSANA